MVIVIIQIALSKKRSYSGKSDLISKAAKLPVLMRLHRLPANEFDLHSMAYPSQKRQYQPFII